MISLAIRCCLAATLLLPVAFITAIDVVAGTCDAGGGCSITCTGGCWAIINAEGGCTKGCVGGNPSPETPIEVAMPLSTLVSAYASSMTGDVFLESLGNRHGWAITVASGVSSFTVTDSWTSTAWGDIVNDIASDNGLCVTVNPTDDSIEFDDC